MEEVGDLKRSVNDTSVVNNSCVNSLKGAGGGYKCVCLLTSWDSRGMICVHIVLRRFTISACKKTQIHINVGNNQGKYIVFLYLSYVYKVKN